MGDSCSNNCGHHRRCSHHRRCNIAWTTSERFTYTVSGLRNCTWCVYSQVDGADASALFLRGVVYGSFTAASFFFVNAFFIAQIGLLVAMSIAVAAGVVMHSFLFHL